MKKEVFLGFLFCMSLTTVFAQPTLVQKQIDSLVNAKAIPGIIIGTVDQGKQKIYTAGYANVEQQTPFLPNTQLEIGSISKTFTPSNLGTSANALLPYEGYNLNKLFSYLVTATPNPVGKVEYSNLGMGLAGVLAERISGKSYESLLKKYISKPFRLKYTSLKTATFQPIATGYFNSQNALYWDMYALNGAGGIKSNTSEMLSYLNYLLMQSSNPIITSITTPTATINKQIKVAKGWHLLSSKEQSKIIWHNGGTYGFSTFCAFNIETGKAVFLAINAFNKNKIADGLGFEIIMKMLTTK
ncbi:MAG: beta-lactamase [Chitinophagaceae bacterium]|nr:MAG: beta-lactamase [Chitinophagaceae bacterium]